MELENLLISNLNTKSNLAEINIKMKMNNIMNRSSDIKLNLLLSMTEILNSIEYNNIEEMLDLNLELKWKHAAFVLNRLFLILSIIYLIITFSAIILPACNLQLTLV